LRYEVGEFVFVSETLGVQHNGHLFIYFIYLFIYDKGPESAIDMPMTVN